MDVMQNSRSVARLDVYKRQLYDQYDAFLSELMEDFNTYAAAKEEETGIAINVEVYNASQSQTTQNNQVEAMAQDGCDIICVNLVDRTAVSYTHLGKL